MCFNWKTFWNGSQTLYRLDNETWDKNRSIEENLSNKPLSFYSTWDFSSQTRLNVYSINNPWRSRFEWNRRSKLKIDFVQCDFTFPVWWRLTGTRSSFHCWACFEIFQLSCWLIYRISSYDIWKPEAKNKNNP